MSTWTTDWQRVGGQTASSSRTPTQARVRVLQEKIYQANVSSFRWFIGCAPCLAEMPGLNQLVSEFKGKDASLRSLMPQIQRKTCEHSSNRRPSIIASFMGR